MTEPTNRPFIARLVTFRPSGAKPTATEERGEGEGGKEEKRLLRGRRRRSSHHCCSLMQIWVEEQLGASMYDVRRERGGGKKCGKFVG